MDLSGIRLKRMGAKGVCIADAPDGRVMLVRGGVPGDVVSVKIRRKRKRMYEAVVDQVEQASDLRIEPVCKHTAMCGGCSWQQMDYEAQSKAKGQEVYDQLRRHGHILCDDMRPIIAAPSPLRYRNKMEFSFSAFRWLTEDEIHGEETISRHALGFHVPGFWDRILDIETCHLQGEPSNAIRNFIRDQAHERGISFWRPRDKTGVLRTLMLRSTQDGQWMLVMQFGEEPGQAGMQLLDDVLKAFPGIVSLYFAVNEKGNDSIYDLDLTLHHGEAYITENMHSAIEGGFPLSFQIGPKSFYQTNPVQAQRLYMEALNLAGITEGDTVYDLYTGTGTIALFMAQKAAKVIGIESVPEAVEAADRNAERNGISHAVFEVGDMRKAFDESFIERHGRPDVVITDPPRDGMHPKVVERLIDLKAPKIVYISCNPATQARDLEKLQAVYDIVTVQPVDMFPQTHHVENVALLHLKNA